MCSDSCNGTIIKGIDTYSLDLNCIGSGSCREAVIYCPYDRVDACNIDCNDNGDHVCYDMDIYVDDTFKYYYLSLSR